MSLNEAVGNGDFEEVVERLREYYSKANDTPSDAPDLNLLFNELVRKAMAPDFVPKYPVGLEPGQLTCDHPVPGGIQISKSSQPATSHVGVVPPENDPVRSDSFHLPVKAGSGIKKWIALVVGGAAAAAVLFMAVCYGVDRYLEARQFQGEAIRRLQDEEISRLRDENKRQEEKREEENRLHSKRVADLMAKVDQLQAEHYVVTDYVADYLIDKKRVLIMSPQNNSTVKNSFKVIGVSANPKQEKQENKDKQENQTKRYWLLVEEGKLYYPRYEVPSEGGAWSQIMSQKPGKFTLVLVELNEDGHKDMLDWLERGRQQDRFPGIPWDQIRGHPETIQSLALECR